MNQPLKKMPSSIHHLHPEIVGWGADLDSSDRPGVPRELNHENVLSGNHHRPVSGKQNPGRDVQLTLERNEFTPVIGNSKSPSLVSGLVRKAAFTFSEDSLRHWMLLLFADRINMVEGWVEDIGKGKVPMILPRMEFRTTDHLRRIMKQGAKSKQDKALVATVALGAVGAVALTYFLVKRARR